ncbi:hypothetical protein F441_20446 [Phytophthora nicotianae CJ01A1]|uniref:Uncharacterized protein n=2 Tax=Phytophthora nicotianae TaxID=4792 RepID=V9E0Q9_PHYNI|nr:hypothetical protein F443_20564 [Phytophthora nicotianae P1569]ETP02501.1 hypothetical protein F441_20446 [Phytophthora nicotianae CJ01A1]
MRHLWQPTQEGVRVQHVRPQPDQRHRDGQQELGRPGHTQQRLGQVEQGHRQGVPVVTG